MALLVTQSFRPRFVLQCPAALVSMQLTRAERGRLTNLLRLGITPAEAHRRLAKTRSRTGLKGPGPDAVFRFASGVTHKPGRKEKRGRHKILKQRDASASGVVSVRRGLQKTLPEAFLNLI